MNFLKNSVICLKLLAFLIFITCFVFSKHVLISSSQHTFGSYGTEAQGIVQLRFTWKVNDLTYRYIQTLSTQSYWQMYNFKKRKALCIALCCPVNIYSDESHMHIYLRVPFLNVVAWKRFFFFLIVVCARVHP